MTALINADNTTTAAPATTSPGAAFSNVMSTALEFVAAKVSQKADDWTDKLSDVAELVGPVVRLLRHLGCHELERGAHHVAERGSGTRCRGGGGRGVVGVDQCSHVLTPSV